MTIAGLSRKPNWLLIPGTPPGASRVQKSCTAEKFRKHHIQRLFSSRNGKCSRRRCSFFSKEIPSSLLGKIPGNRKSLKWHVLRPHAQSPKCHLPCTLTGGW